MLASPGVFAQAGKLDPTVQRVVSGVSSAHVAEVMNGDGAAFAGEEIGLVGSYLYADKANARNDRIEAVFNNDIVGYDVTGDGRTTNGYVHVFSDEPADSLSREVARYVRECAQRYVPGFRAEPVFRADRFSRGGDRKPFVSDGYVGVRFTTPVVVREVTTGAKEDANFPISRAANRSTRPCCHGKTISPWTIWRVTRSLSAPPPRLTGTTKYSSAK